MSYSDRKKQITQLLREKTTIDIKSLTKLLYASEATVRRDLNKLEQEGLIIRTHGKAVSTSVYADKNEEFRVRETFASPIKKQIALAAVRDCVSNGQVVMLDASSTAMCTIEFLNKLYKDLIVITSGIKTLMSLSQTNIKFYSTGGRAINDSSSFIGQTAINTIKSFNADVCFISCHGLSEKGYATDTSEFENDVRRTILNQSKRKVLLIDASKINKKCWHNLCSLSLFDDVFCNTPLPDEIAKNVKNFHLV